MNYSLFRFALCAISIVGGDDGLSARERDTTPPWEVGSMFPQWSSQRPSRIVNLYAESTASDLENGRRLEEAIVGLRPGDILKIGPGRYSIQRKLSLDLRGQADAPIWVVGADPEHKPVITRPDARQNVLNLGDGTGAEFVCFRDLEFTGGSTLIRLYRCRQIWIDRCHLHHSGAEGITANSRDTSQLFITNNHLHHFVNTKATGEAMYLGANNGKSKMTYSVIANNHVHHCSGQQGDGIEVKQGSHHNWIVGNRVHDCQYPCIIAYGTAGNGINLIERNVCYRSLDNVMQVQGEAIVRNNLLMSARGAAFASTDHQGKTRDLEFVHNTIVSARLGANLSSWNSRANLVFANNIVYTNNSTALRFPRGADGVTLAGNLLLGKTQGVTLNARRGVSLKDFFSVSWDARDRDARLVNVEQYTGTTQNQYSPEVDLLGMRRQKSNPIPGAFESR